MKRSTLIMLAAIVFVGGSLAWMITSKKIQLGQPHSLPQTRVTGKVKVGGPFTMTDHTGKQVTEKDYAGKFMLVYFGYTFCPDVCPTELQAMSETLNMLGDEADKLTPILVTIDPDRDGVKEMAAYVAAFHKRLVGLTGTKEQIAAMAKGYRAYYKKVPPAEGEDKNDYAVDHSAIVYLMDKKGEYSTHFAYNTPPETMLKKIREKLTE